jgi:hypothetical protein
MQQRIPLRHLSLFLPGVMPTPPHRLPLTVAGLLLYVFLVTYALRVYTMMPERWPEILTAVIVLGGALWGMFRSLGKMVDEVKQNKEATNEFRTEFKDAMAQTRESLHLQELKVDGIEREVLEMKAYLRARGLLEPIRPHDAEERQSHERQ